MRIFTQTLLAAACLVLALALLSSVSERSVSDDQAAIEAPSLGIPDVLDRDNPLFACLVSPAAASEAVFEPGDTPCTTGADRAPSTDVQMTEC